MNSRRHAPRNQEREPRAEWPDQTAYETDLGLTEAHFRRPPTLRCAASAEDALHTDHRPLSACHLLQATPLPIRG